MIDHKVLDNLEILGERYCSRYLEAWPDIDKNWWTAFRFFFDHAFMRGRRDELSTEYYRFAISGLESYFGIPAKPSEGDFRTIARHHEDFGTELEDITRLKKESGRKLTTNSIKLQAFHEGIVSRHPFVASLVTESHIEGQRSLDNDKDLMMVLSALSFLTRPGMPANIHNYMADKLKDGNGDELAKELQQIRFVGDKLASFILRDVILLNPELAAVDSHLVFPVDTWVIKIAKRFGCESESYDEVREFFIGQIMGRSTAKVAAGLWYLGFNSLGILLNNIDKVDMAGWD